MKYNVEFSKLAFKQLKKFSKKDQILLLKKINILSENPAALKPIRLVNVDAFRIRMGSYRIIYQIKQEMIEILILKIGHRKNIYRDD